jgi:hypothetical protein
VESCLSSDEVAVVGEGYAAFCDCGAQIGEGFEVAVDDGFVAVGPEGFGGLEFGDIRRQADQADAFGDPQRCRVPSGAVED